MRPAEPAARTAREDRQDRQDREDREIHQEREIHGRRRRRLAVAGALLLVVGMGARFGLGGWIADAAGGATYAALIYVLVALAAPGRPAEVVAAAALAFCVAVELFQLTDLPQTFADAFSPSRLVFGTSFNAADLPPYAVGAGLAMAVDRLLRSRGRAASARG